MVDPSGEIPGSAKDGAGTTGAPVRGACAVSAIGRSSKRQSSCFVAVTAFFTFSRGAFLTRVGPHPHASGSRLSPLADASRALRAARLGPLAWPQALLTLARYLRSSVDFLKSGVTSRLPFSRYGTPFSIHSGFGASFRK
jgi:hypothetical protein